ncbi:MAG: hypothetical protein QXP80_05545, partial [Zestosphaera sp.]
MCLLIIAIFSQLATPQTRLSEAYLSVGTAFNVVRISDPTYCLPEMVRSGESFNVTFTYSGTSIEVSSVKLYSVGSEYAVIRWTRVTSETGTIVINVLTPPEIAPGLYTIVAVVRVDNVEYEVVSPRSLWVVDEYPTSL